MKNKKALLTLASIVLVAAVSVAGTFAFLTAQSNAVTNTFVAEGAGKIIDDDPATEDTEEGTFVIEETAVTQNEDGTYSTASGTTSSGIDFKILPGLTLPKKATIKVTGKTKVPAYLYCEVKADLTDDVYEWEVDPDNWIKLDSVTGAQEGDVYVYTTDGTNPAIVKATDTDYTNLPEIGILKDNQIKVKDDVTEDVLKDITDTNKDSIEFYSYLAQASAGTDAATAYTNCFTPAP